MFDIKHSMLGLIDLPGRVRRRLSKTEADYRLYLFEELAERLKTSRPLRVLEIGPRDGEDTARLAALDPDTLVLVDLPDKKQRIDTWLPKIQCRSVELVIANFMYDRMFDEIEPFDLIWCTGVLYHNPEQLRFIRQLFDATAPGGHLVLESAIARLPGTRNANCVEIWYPPNKTKGRKYHVSNNVSHLPSRLAMKSWLEMVGYDDVEESRCMRRVGLALNASRAAFVARRPVEKKKSIYYALSGEGFPLARAR